MGGTTGCLSFASTVIFTINVTQFSLQETGARLAAEDESVGAGQRDKVPPAAVSSTASRRT